MSFFCVRASVFVINDLYANFKVFFFFYLFIFFFSLRKLRKEQGNKCAANKHVRFVGLQRVHELQKQCTVFLNYNNNCCNSHFISLAVGLQILHSLSQTAPMTICTTTKT